MGGTGRRRREDLTGSDHLTGSDQFREGKVATPDKDSLVEGVRERIMLAIATVKHEASVSDRLPPTPI